MGHVYIGQVTGQPQTPALQAAHQAHAPDRRPAHGSPAPMKFPCSHEVQLSAAAAALTRGPRGSAVRLSRPMLDPSNTCDPTGPSCRAHGSCGACQGLQPRPTRAGEAISPQAPITNRRPPPESRSCAHRQPRDAADVPTSIPCTQKPVNQQQVGTGPPAGAHGLALFSALALYAACWGRQRHQRLLAAAVGRTGPAASGTGSTALSQRLGRTPACPNALPRGAAGHSRPTLPPQQLVHQERARAHCLLAP